MGDNAFDILIWSILCIWFGIGVRHFAGRIYEWIISIGEDDPFRAMQRRVIQQGIDEGYITHVNGKPVKK